VPPGCSEQDWFHTDSLGSVLAWTDASRNVTRFDYLPWGESLPAPPVSAERQYNGRVVDFGTGFYDYGARMYWPLIGRFISADIAATDSSRPQSWNAYAYVLNTPYNHPDPTGHTPNPQGNNEGPLQPALEEVTQQTAQAWGIFHTGAEALSLLGAHFSPASEGLLTIAGFAGGVGEIKDKHTIVGSLTLLSVSLKFGGLAAERAGAGHLAAGLGKLAWPLQLFLVYYQITNAFSEFVNDRIGDHTNKAHGESAMVHDMFNIFYIHELFGVFNVNFEAQPPEWQQYNVMKELFGSSSGAPTCCEYWRSNMNPQSWATQP